MTIYGPIAIGVPPNMSLLAAVSAGLIPANIMMAAAVARNPGGCPTLMSSLSTQGATGTTNKLAGTISAPFSGNGPTDGRDGKPTGGSVALIASGDANNNGLNSALIISPPQNNNNIDFGG